jgi:hypothetical protein
VLEAAQTSSPPNGARGYLPEALTNYRAHRSVAGDGAMPSDERASRFRLETPGTAPAFDLGKLAGQSPLA